MKHLTQTGMLNHYRPGMAVILLPERSRTQDWQMHKKKLMSLLLMGSKAHANCKLCVSCRWLAHLSLPPVSQSVGYKARAAAGNCLFR